MHTSPDQAGALGQALPVLSVSPSIILSFTLSLSLFSIFFFSFHLSLVSTMACTSSPVLCLFLGLFPRTGHLNHPVQSRSLHHLTHSHSVCHCVTNK